MTWAPTNKVVDLTKVVDNLLGYIEAQQTDALVWAKDTSDDALPDFAGIYPNATGRLATKFPQLIVLDQEHLAEAGDTDNGDIVRITLALTLEVALTGPDADALVLTTKKYGLALESMLVNIPAATLTADSKATTHGYLAKYQTVYDVVVGYKKEASNWLQIFQTRVEYVLLTGAF